MTDPPRGWGGNRSRVSDEERRITSLSQAASRRLHPWAVLSLCTAGALAVAFGPAIFVPPPPSTAQVPAGELVGRAAVTDGDTIEIRGQTIHLHGIDAPEAAQRCALDGEGYRCGQIAAFVLANRIGQQTVACEAKDADRAGRIRAVCRAGGADLNAFMVRSGWALAHRTTSADYADEEAAAEADRLGLWRGDFLPPWHWRRGQRLERPVASDTERGGCWIKGNITRDGERIYYAPDGRAYDRARINEDKGERWFCSEAEARAAGWLPAQD